jgi:hypothetical protein
LKSHPVVFKICQVAGGRMLGPDQPIILHLLDIEPAKQALEGVKMELLDAAFPLLKGEGSGTPASLCFMSVQSRMKIKLVLRLSNEYLVSSKPGFFL